MLNTVVYLRQSKDRDGDGLAVDRQRDDALRIAELRDYNVVDVFVDNDVTASGRRQRPGFEAVLAAVASGQVRVVIAWDMTRLTRNRRDTVRILEAGERHGVTLSFVRGGSIDLSSPAGRLVADLLAGVARHEIEQKSDRQRRANAQAAQQGRPAGGRRPYGYESDGLTLRRDEADALARTYQAVAAGSTLGAAARALNDAGHHTSQVRRTDGRPSPWTTQNLRGVLLNPRYCGLRAVATGPRAWRIVGPAVWPALVDEATWASVDRLLRDPDRRTNAPRYDQRLLTGLAHCGWPGCTSLVHAGANSRGQGTYRCRDVPTGGHISRRADPVDEYIGLIVVERLSRPDAADLLVDRDRVDVDDMCAQRRELRARRHGLAALFADGVLTQEDVRAQADRLDAQIAELSAQLTHPRSAALADLVADPGPVWQRMDTGRRRAAVDALMVVRLLPVGRGTRTFRPETVQITPR